MTIHQIVGHAIRTDNIYPPIKPWALDNGRTEQEAIDDLIENHPREPKAAVPAPVVALLAEGIVITLGIAAWVVVLCIVTMR